MLTLAILHNIFLDAKQRYSLAQGKSIETWGVSVPTYFNGKMDKATHSNEVFCKYTLTNNPEDYPVIINSDGYTINLPQSAKKVKRLTPDQIKTLIRAEQDNFYEDHPVPITAVDLLDREDGGIECCIFKKSIKTRKLHTIHTIEIQTIELLEKSLS